MDTSQPDTPGEGGVKLRASREYTFIPNILLGGIDLILTGEPDKLSKAVGYEVGHVFGDAGIVRTAVNLYANYDPHFDRDIEPDGLKDKRKNDRYDERTLGLAKGLAWGMNYMLPREMQISPLQAQFFMQNATGGALTRWAGTVERITGYGDQELSLKDIPFARGLFFDDYNQSVSELYDKVQMAREDAGSGDKAAEGELFKLRQYQAMMKHLRDAESETYKPQEHITGLARQALGKEPLEKFPNPFMGQAKFLLKRKPTSLMVWSTTSRLSPRALECQSNKKTRQTRSTKHVGTSGIVIVN